MTTPRAASSARSMSVNAVSGSRITTRSASAVIEKTDNASAANAVRGERVIRLPANRPALRRNLHAEIRCERILRLGAEGARELQFQRDRVRDDSRVRIQRRSGV